MSMSDDAREAVNNLKNAEDALGMLIQRRTWTIAEMKEIRRILLHTVREHIDPYALGHAREERRY